MHLKPLLPLLLTAALPALSIAQDADPLRQFRIPSAPSASFESTPDLKGPAGKTTQRRTKWMLIEVPIEWSPTARRDDKGDPISNFLDELELEVFALLNCQAPSARAALLSGKVKLLHVQGQQRNTRAAMLISPRMLESLFEGRPPTTPNAALFLQRDSIGAVLRYQGKIVATWPDAPPLFWEALEQATRLPADQILKLPNRILPRWQTPFAFSNWDYYEEEAIEPQSSAP